MGEKYQKITNGDDADKLGVGIDDRDAPDVSFGHLADRLEDSSLGLNREQVLGHEVLCGRVAGVTAGCRERKIAVRDDPSGYAIINDDHASDAVVS